MIKKMTANPTGKTVLPENDSPAPVLADRQIDESGISPKLVALSEHDLHARAFKLLRTTLNRQVTEHGYQVIGVTSCTPNAGKSFIASNLAASISRLASRNTVLVDLDLQRASIAELFGIPDQAAVVEYLLGSVDRLADICWTVGDGELSVFPTFLRKGNSAELLSGERFATFMSELRQLEGTPLIICDLPPLFVSDDALLAAQQLDGVLVVVEQGVTTRKQLEAAMRMLYPTKLIGTVFNRFSGGIGDPYGYAGGYGSYYK